MPANACCTTASCAKFFINMAMIRMIRMGPVRNPVVAATAPFTPPRFSPIKVETFSAIIPGVHCPMEK